jgi:LysM repeat protein
MKKELLSLLAIPVIAATFASCSSPHRQIRIATTPTGIEESVESQSTQSADEREPTQKIRRAPQYKIYKGYGTKCAGYSVLAAIDAFNKEMFYAKAWKLRDRNKVVAQVNGNNGLRKLAKNGTLETGMIVGFYNPHSQFNKKNREYTHTAVFAGEEDGKLIFYHQYVDRMEKISLEDLGNEYDCSAREVLGEKTSKTRKISKARNYHTVKKGDTFWNISKRNNISLQQLKKYNPRIAPTKIYPKQKIRIR